MHAVLFIGIQGSGKSTFYRERFFETHVRLSLDLLRTRHRERLLLAACLAARQAFVIDNTNVRIEQRAVYLQAAHGAGFRTSGYYFVTDLQAALRRNAAREGLRKIPVAGVIGTFKRLEPPRLEEGFDELFTVAIDDGGAFVVQTFPTV